MKEQYIKDYANMVRCSVINRLIQENGYKKYLEIGVFDSQNFNNVQIAYKAGVDPGVEGFDNVTFPMTSDEFFELTNDKFDIIFCDGLHYSEQTYKDIVNSLDHLNEGGVVIVHDMNPTTKELQSRIRECPTCWWNGDCWKSFVQLRTERDDLEMCVIDSDMGLGIIHRGDQKKLEISDELTYDNLEQNREQWLNLVSIDNFSFKIN